MSGPWKNEREIIVTGWKASIRRAKCACGHKLKKHDGMRQCKVVRCDCLAYRHLKGSENPVPKATDRAVSGTEQAP